MLSLQGVHILYANVQNCQIALKNFQMKVEAGF